MPKYCLKAWGFPRSYRKKYPVETSSALDVTSPKMVIKMLRQIRDTGLISSMIFITHELPLLYNVTDDIMVMSTTVFIVVPCFMPVKKIENGRCVLIDERQGNRGLSA